jgi:cysteine sulfinate desulfinase/cysteine desulfurase-like protein
MHEEQTRVAALRDRLEKGLLQRIGNAVVTGDVDSRLPNTSNIAFEFIEGEGILLLLNKEGIACSSGSACTFAGAIACAARDEGAIHGRAWRDPVFVFARQHR